jgi:hypothetical protein
MNAEYEDPRGTGSVTPSPAGISAATEVVTRVENFFCCRRRNLMQVGNRVEKPLKFNPTSYRYGTDVGDCVSLTCYHFLLLVVPNNDMFYDGWMLTRNSSTCKNRNWLPWFEYAVSCQHEFIP